MESPVLLLLLLCDTKEADLGTLKEQRWEGCTPTLHWAEHWDHRTGC